VFKGRCIAVVIPAYRGEATIAAVIRGLPDLVDHVVVVDDASPDGTSEVVVALADPRVHLLRTTRNRGVGGAMKAGLREALRLGVDIAVKMDADGQMRPELLPDLLDPLCSADYDYSKGNRFYDRQALASMPRLRLLGNVASSFLTKLASGCWNVFDTQNGYLAMTAGLLRRLDIDRLAEGYFFENSLLIQLNILDVPVVEVPMPARYGGEISSLRPWRMVWQHPPRLLGGLLYRLWHKYFLMHTSPVALLLLCGWPMLLFGVAFGAYHWYVSIATGVPATTGTVMLAVLPIVLGVQFLLEALIMDASSAPKGPAIVRLGEEGVPDDTAAGAERERHEA